MALIKCKECEHQVSDKAKSCPNCGCPIEANYNEIGMPQPLITAPKVKEEKRYSVAIPLIFGIAAYIILSVVLCKQLDKGAASIETAIEDDVMTCGLVCFVITCFIAKSNIDRLIYLAVIVLVSWMSIANWEELMYGSAVIVFVAEFAIIIVAAIKRNRPTRLSQSGIVCVDSLFALPLVALLLFYGFAGAKSAFSEVNAPILNKVLWFIGGSIAFYLNWLFLKWFFKKEITNSETRKIANNVALGLLGVTFFAAVLFGIIILMAYLQYKQ